LRALSLFATARILALFQLTSKGPLNHKPVALPVDVRGDFIYGPRML
jgi:hypothetical protein